MQSAKQFISHVLCSNLKTLLTEDYPLSTQLSVMLMIHKNMAYVVEDTEKEISKTFSKILSIVVENNMMLPEEFFEVEAAVKQITEEGESAAPTNVVAGIEPTVPRIKRKPTNDPIVTDSN